MLPFIDVWGLLSRCRLLSFKSPRFALHAVDTWHFYTAQLWPMAYGGVPKWWHPNSWMVYDNTKWSLNGDFHKWGYPKLVGLSWKIPWIHGWLGGTGYPSFEMKHLHSSHATLQTSGFTVCPGTIWSSLWFMAMNKHGLFVEHSGTALIKKKHVIAADHLQRIFIRVYHHLGLYT